MPSVLILSSISARKKALRSQVYSSVRVLQTQHGRRPRFDWGWRFFAAGCLGKMLSRLLRRSPLSSRLAQSSSSSTQAPSHPPQTHHWREILAGRSGCRADAAALESGPSQLAKQSSAIPGPSTQLMKRNRDTQRRRGRSETGGGPLTCPAYTTHTHYSNRVVITRGKRTEAVSRLTARLPIPRDNMGSKRQVTRAAPSLVVGDGSDLMER